MRASIGVLLLLAAALSLGGQTAQPQPQMRVAIPAGRAVAVEPETVEVASAVPQGRGFVFTFADLQVARTTSQFGTDQRRATPITVDEVKSTVSETAQRKLAEMFPNGVPPSLAARVKIHVTVKLSKPPEIGVSVEW